MLVAKLRRARERKRRTGVKVEGRKSVAEMRPETVKLVRQLARKRPKGGKRSLAQIAAELAAAGHRTRAGTSYAPMAVKRMLESGSVQAAKRKPQEVQQ